MGMTPENQSGLPPIESRPAVEREQPMRAPKGVSKSDAQPSDAAYR